MEEGLKMRFGKLIGLLFGSLVLATARAACAEVIITNPTNGATVNGTITVSAQITSAWWSKLWVDGKGIAVSGIGNVSFTWKTNSFANGTHTLQVDAYPSGKPANAAETIKVNVNNSGTSPVGHFYTLPASASLPNDETCAAEIPWEQEMVPDNQGPNNTKPTSAQLQAYANNGYAWSPYNGTWAYARVDGQYTGTTDMIFRWAACKWGIDEDVVRAQATDEHWSWDQLNSGGDKHTVESQCVNGDFTSLWNYECSDCCYDSWGDFQTKVYYDWQTWPMMQTSTAFSADYRFADQRACMDGDLAPYFAGKPAYNGHTYAGDIASGNLNTILWGCIGLHYSGSWYDGDSTSGAVWYINALQQTAAQKPWKTRWPSVNWPD
ncbi:MAG TPA: Ig-like domain-containing protein [Candidatus Binataceae bacterium]|jgi:autotransporter family porin